MGWGGGSHKRPRFQSTAQEVFARGQLYVVVCSTGMTSAMIQVFIQPQTEVSTDEKKKRNTMMYIGGGSEDRLQKLQDPKQGRIQIAGRGKRLSLGGRGWGEGRGEGRDIVTSTT